MQLIEWTDRYSVGNEVFDNEHKKLFAIINELNDTFEHGGGRVAAEKALDELLDYTDRHFGHEEALFADYPDKAAHLIAHQELRAQVLDYRAAMAQKGGMEMVMELVAFLQFWLLQHIISVDKRFCRWLSERGTPVT
jgi:hemerythrin-like metal-binding protein